MDANDFLNSKGLPYTRELINVNDERINLIHLMDEYTALKQSNFDDLSKQFELKPKFTEKFFNEFQFDAEFRGIFEAMARGLTPYEAIEHLCKSKKELSQELQKALETRTRK